MVIAEARSKAGVLVSLVIILTFPRLLDYFASKNATRLVVQHVYEH